MSRARPTPLDAGADLEIEDVHRTLEKQYAALSRSNRDLEQILLVQVVQSIDDFWLGLVRLPR